MQPFLCNFTSIQQPPAPSTLLQSFRPLLTLCISKSPSTMMAFTKLRSAITLSSFIVKCKKKKCTSNSGLRRAACPSLIQPSSKLGLQGHLKAAATSVFIVVAPRQKMHPVFAEEPFAHQQGQSPLLIHALQPQPAHARPTFVHKLVAF